MIYVNGSVLVSVDDAKGMREIRSTQDCNSIQKDVERLQLLSDTWLMKIELDQMQSDDGRIKLCQK